MDFMLGCDCPMASSIWDLMRSRSSPRAIIAWQAVPPPSWIRPSRMCSGSTMGCPMRRAS